MKTLREWAAKILPWLVTSALVGYLAYTTDINAALSTLKDANWWAFVPAVLGVVAVVFVVDTWSLKLLFSRFNTPVTYTEMLPLKGTSYFLNVINYNAAAAGIALFFRNKKGIPFLEALGSMLWMNFIDIVALATLMLLGLAVSGGAGISADYLQILIGLAGFIYVVLLGSCIYWNLGFDWFFLRRFRSWTIFRAFSQAKASDYVAFIGLRTLFVSTYVISQWICMPLFNMHAGLMELFLYVPVLTFVGTIPLTTIAGMGTVQLLMREFYTGFVPQADTHLMEAHIDAYSTTTILAFVLARIAIGYLSMGSVARDFERHRTARETTDPSPTDPSPADPSPADPSPADPSPTES